MHRRGRLAAIGLAAVLVAVALVPGLAQAQADRTRSRPYVVASGSSALGPANCWEQVSPAPAVDAACFALDWPDDEAVDVSVEDEVDAPVLARAVFLDSGGNHLGSWLFCGAEAFEIPAWSATLQVWVQPAWAGAVNTAQETVDANELACEPAFGTRGVVTAAIQ